MRFLHVYNFVDCFNIQQNGSGYFVVKQTRAKCVKVLILSKGVKKSISFIWRLSTCMAILIILCGDVERNPGPPRQDPARNKKQPLDTQAYEGLSKATTPRHDTLDGVVTRQRTMSSYAFSQPSPSPLHNSGTTQNSQSRSTIDFSNYSEMFTFLRNMKIDLDKQNERLVTEIGGINTKIDSIFSTISELKQDNDRLSSDNLLLREEVSQMKNKLDQIENQSRRNNLRFNGIDGSINENWDVSERKVRSFLKDTLNFGDEADTFEIDRAHRIKSRDPSKCTIMVRFTRFKDCELILGRANRQLQHNRSHSVQQDFSDKVRKHSHILGERMVQERTNDNYAVIR